MYAVCTENKSKFGKWVIYCDANNNTAHDGDEQSENIIFYKNKCEKPKISATMDCGSAEVTEPVPTTTTTTTTTAAPCDCVIPDKFLGLMGDGAQQECIKRDDDKYTIRFSCDSSANDPDFVSEQTGKCKKLKKIPKKKLAGKCGVDCPCQKQMDAVTKKINKQNGNENAKSTCTHYHKKKPTWAIYCDGDGDDVLDAGEFSEEQKEKCRQYDFDIENFQC